MTHICDGCGASCPKRKMVGIGSGGRMTWLCEACILDGKCDDVFGAIGKKLVFAVAKAGKEPA